MRVLPTFGEERMRELEAAWKRKHSERGRKRLQVIRLVAQHRLNAGQIAEAAGVGRSVVFDYINKFVEGGVAGLLARARRTDNRGRLDGESREALKSELAKGTFKRTVEAQRWLEKRSIKLALSTVYYHLGKSGALLEGAAQDPRKKRRGKSTGLPGKSGRNAR